MSFSGIESQVSSSSLGSSSSSSSSSSNNLFGKSVHNSIELVPDNVEPATDNTEPAFSNAEPASNNTDSLLPKTIGESASSKSLTGTGTSLAGTLTGTFLSEKTANTAQQHLHDLSLSISPTPSGFSGGRERKQNEGQVVENENRTLDRLEESVTNSSEVKEAVTNSSEVEEKKDSSNHHNSLQNNLNTFTDYNMTGLSDFRPSAEFRPPDVEEDDDEDSEGDGGRALVDALLAQDTDSEGDIHIDSEREIESERDVDSERDIDSEGDIDREGLDGVASDDDNGLKSFEKGTGADMVMGSKSTNVPSKQTDVTSEFTSTPEDSDRPVPTTSTFATPSTSNNKNPNPTKNKSPNNKTPSENPNRKPNKNPPNSLITLKNKAAKLKNVIARGNSTMKGDRIIAENQLLKALVHEQNSLISDLQKELDAVESGRVTSRTASKGIASEVTGSNRKISNGIEKNLRSEERLKKSGDSQRDGHRDNHRKLSYAKPANPPDYFRSILPSFVRKSPHVKGDLVGELLPGKTIFGIMEEVMIGETVECWVRVEFAEMMKVLRRGIDGKEMMVLKRGIDGKEMMKVLRRGIDATEVAAKSSDPITREAGWQTYTNRGIRQGGSANRGGFQSGLSVTSANINNNNRNKASQHGKYLYVRAWTTCTSRNPAQNSKDSSASASTSVALEKILPSFGLKQTLIQFARSLNGTGGGAGGAPGDGDGGQQELPGESILLQDVFYSLDLDQDKVLNKAEFLVLVDLLRCGVTGSVAGSVAGQGSLAVEESTEVFSRNRLERVWGEFFRRRRGEALEAVKAGDEAGEDGGKGGIAEEVMTFQIWLECLG